MAKGKGTTQQPAARKRPAGRNDERRKAPYIRGAGTALVVIALFSLLSLFLGGGDATSFWVKFLFGAFGWGAYLTPPLFGFFGVALLWPAFHPQYHLRWREAAGWLLIFGFFLILFQLLGGAASPWAGGGPVGGGALGGMFASFFEERLGLGATYAIIAMSGLGGILLAAGLGPRELWGSLYLVLLVAAWLARRVPPALAVAGRTLLALSRRLVGTVKTWRARKAEPRFKINRPEEEPALLKPDAGRVRAQRGNRKGEAMPTADADGQNTIPLPELSIARRSGDGTVAWQLPPLALCEPGGEGAPSEADIQQKVKTIEDTLRDFRINARVVEVNPGPVVTQFGLDPGFRERRDRKGNVVRRDRVKVGEITKLRDDLALALAARTVRIEAPVPGRAVIGLEIPNTTASVVRLRRVIETTAFQRVLLKSKLALALGQDVSGAAVAADLTKAPHLLIAGATGAGKSVCMNAIIACLLLHTTPDDLRMVMIDPKRVELTSFRDIPHLLRSVVVDPDQAVTVLRWIVHEMETRLRRFEAQGVRNIDGYNKLMRGGKDAMPYMVVLIDELADLMMTAADEVERSVCRLAQLARATGIHLIIATQRPSVDVVTGLIKANFPTRIAFAVASQVDSRTILDGAGAEQLLGSGDMLYMAADAPKPRRLQGVFVADEELKKLVHFWRSQGPPNYVPQLEEAEAYSKEDDEQNDPMYDRAVEVARQHTRISASLLQRRLNVGYNRAARLVDLLEERGVVGSAEGGRPREVLMPEGDESALPPGG